jgi:hypothetical protein
LSFVVDVANICIGLEATVVWEVSSESIVLKALHGWGHPRLQTPLKLSGRLGNNRCQLDDAQRDEPSSDVYGRPLIPSRFDGLARGGFFFDRRELPGVGHYLALQDAESPFAAVSGALNFKFVK